MTDQGSDDERCLVSDSDRLLYSLEPLRLLEREKRSVPIASPRFHELAEQITDLATDVFGATSDQELDGNRTDRTGRSIDEAAEAPID